MKNSSFDKLKDGGPLSFTFAIANDVKGDIWRKMVSLRDVKIGRQCSRTPFQQVSPLLCHQHILERIGWVG